MLNITDFQSVIINPEPELKELFSGALRAPSHNISDYYQWNKISTFSYDKAFHVPTQDKENEHRVCCQLWPIVLYIVFLSERRTTWYWYCTLIIHALM